MTALPSRIQSPPGSPLYLALWPMLVCAVILYSSLLTGGPQVPDAVGFPYVGKVGHFFVFGLLANLVFRVSISVRGPRFSFIAAVAIVSMFGAIDELVQGANPYRSMEFGDWLVDSAGAFVAVSAYVFWPLYRNVLEYPLFRRRNDNHGGKDSREANPGVARGDCAAR